MSKLLLHCLALVLLAGCAQVGNAKIKDVTPAQVIGMSKADLIAAYGPPTLHTITVQDGVSREECAWSYAYVGLGTVESASLAVTFGPDGVAVSSTAKMQ